MIQISMFDDIIVDSFAGGGGASTGIEQATGHIIDIAINHDESAILMHRRNHPATEHYCEDVRAVDPVAACRGRHVRLAWFSPDCKHFSRAKGAALVDKHIRGLAWIVLRWAGTVRPDVIMLENVPEFVTWGPVRKGKPVKSKAGITYAKWRKQLIDLGYLIDSRELCAADYGAPTIRTRFCLVARCDGNPIVWPTPTHAKRDSEAVKRGEANSWRSAAEIIDWDLPCYSIFESAAFIKEKYGARVVRPLKDNTLRRIARGLDKFVIRNPQPYIMSNNTNYAPHSVSDPVSTIPTGDRNYFVKSYLMEYYGNGQPIDMSVPMHTVTVKDREALVMVYLSKFFTGVDGADAAEPLPTVTAIDHNALTMVFLAHFKGQDKGQDLKDPLMTVTASDGQFGFILMYICKYIAGVDLGYWSLVRDLLNRYCEYNLKDNEVIVFDIRGTLYIIVDIGLRMLAPRELYNAMGFPSDYIIDQDDAGRPISRADQVARCGNAVCPPLARAVVAANLPDMCNGG